MPEIPEESESPCWEVVMPWLPRPTTNAPGQTMRRLSQFFVRSVAGRIKAWPSSGLETFISLRESLRRVSAPILRPLKHIGKFNGRWELPPQLQILQTHFTPSET